MKRELLHVSSEAKRRRQTRSRRLRLTRSSDILQYNGEVAEWLKAPVSKTGRRETVSGVQISPSP